MDQPMLRNPFVLVALGIALLLALVLALNSLFPGALSDFGQGPELTAKVVLLVFLISTLVLQRGISMTESLRYGVIWLGIALVLVLGYSLRHDAAAVGQRLFSALVPSAAQELAPGEIALTRASNGHFLARAQVKGPDLTEATVMFLVDTGASQVSLTAADARRLGIDPDRLRYDQIVRTANGTNMVARIRLRRIAIGSVVVDDVAAQVVPDGLDVSLLGNSFLNTLSAFEIDGDRLTLRE